MQWKDRLPAYTLTVVFTIGILWLTLSPRPTGDVHLHLFAGQDKVAHLLMFGAWTWALIAERHRAGHRSEAWVWCFVAIAFGGVIELAQEALAMGRSAEWGDLAADSVGALCGTMAAILSRRHAGR